MNNIQENKLLYHLDRVTGSKKPITADIFLTNFCNNKCPYCTFWRWDELTKEANYMKYNDFVKNAKILQSAGVKGFILTGGGEPTVSPDFDKITEYLEENNLQYGINTNFVEYKEIKPQYLKVSLDVSNRKDYIEKRGVDKYDQVVANIKKYISWKKENNVKTNLGLQCLVTDISDIEKFYNEFKDLDFDYMVFRPFESTQGEYYLDKDVSFIIAGLELLRSKDDRVSINYKWYNLDVKFTKCHAHWTQIAVNEKSEIMYCCHKPYEVICNLQGLDSIKQWSESTTDISKCDVPCRLTGPNKFIKSIEGNSKDVSFI